MKYVVFDRDTKEVLISINELKNGAEIVERDDIDVKIYGDTEPVFEDIDGNVYIKENCFKVKL